MSSTRWTPSPVQRPIKLPFFCCLAASLSYPHSMAELTNTPHNS